MAEEIARAFHEAYERLAPQHGYETRKASAVPWEDVPAENKALMTAVAAELLEQKIIKEGERLRAMKDSPSYSQPASMQPAINAVQQEIAKREQARTGQTDPQEEN